jgi:hypothetical protein
MTQLSDYHRDRAAEYDAVYASWPGRDEWIRLRYFWLATFGLR